MLRALSRTGLVAALLLSAAARAAAYEAETLDLSLDAAVQMADEMSKSVNSLSRDVTTYHWQPRAVVGVPVQGGVDPRDPRAIGYFKGVANHFWDNAPSFGLMMGNGLYVATDPIISDGYGGGPDSWALLVVTLKAGTRLFDSRQSPDFSSSLRSRLTALGCPDWKNPLQFFRNDPVPSLLCANAFHKAVSLLDVQGTVYGWGGVSFGACKIDRFRSETPAMVLFDTRLSSGVRVLVKEVPREDPAEIHDLRVRIKRFFHLAIGFSGWMPQLPDPWPSIKDEEPADMIEWIQSHTYFCDSANWEDLMPSQLFFAPAELVEKRDEIEEKAAIVSSRLGRTLRPERFRGVIGLQYYTPAELADPQSTSSPEFLTWLEVQTAQVQPAAQAREPLSLRAVRRWILGMWGVQAPTLLPQRAEALSLLLDELSAALLHPLQASQRDKVLLRDTGALVHTYCERISHLAPFGDQLASLNEANERLARMVVDYIAAVRGWPPILVRGSLQDDSPLGALKAVILMDRCLDRYLSGSVSNGSDCEMIGATP